MTIRAYAEKAGMLDSAEASAAYIISWDTVATPTFSPSGSTYNSDQNIEISCTTPGATIWYTTNGDDPTDPLSTRAVYLTAVSVTGDGTSKTIRVYAEKAGMLDSAAYTIEYFWSFIFGKFVDSSSGEYDIDWWIKKLDQDGVETTVGWDKVFDGGFFAEDYALAVGIDSSDNVYVADAMSDGVLGKGEETDITCSADVDGNLGSLYFTIYSIDEGLEDGFYVWYNVAAS
ncbi:hypothetical protein LCGC14_1640410, partial [marine sediment metagenome]